jgi:hypothetical protein
LPLPPLPPLPLPLPSPPPPRDLRAHMHAQRGIARSAERDTECESCPRPRLSPFVAHLHSGAHVATHWGVRVPFPPATRRDIGATGAVAPVLQDTSGLSRLECGAVHTRASMPATTQTTQTQSAPLTSPFAFCLHVTPFPPLLPPPTTVSPRRDTHAFSLSLSLPVPAPRTRSELTSQDARLRGAVDKDELGDRGSSGKRGLEQQQQQQQHRHDGFPSVHVLVHS